jgi:6-phosphofructokinase 1
MVIELMGHKVGWLTLAAGLAGGADVILIPEIPYNLERVAAHINKVRQAGRNFALIVVAEAVKDQGGHLVQQEHTGGAKTYGGIGHRLGEEVARLTGAETRVTVLGHVQRGGEPTAVDRLLGSAFGVHAVDLVAQGKFDRMVGWQNRQVVDVPLEEAIKKPHRVDLDGALVHTARGLDICLGDR